MSHAARRHQSTELILTPSAAGTGAQVAGAFEQIIDPLAGGISLDEVVLPRTPPNDLNRLALFLA